MKNSALSDSVIRATGAQVARRPLGEVATADRAAVIAGTIEQLPTPAGMSAATKAQRVRESLLSLWSAANEDRQGAAKQTAHSKPNAKEHRPLERTDGTVGPLAVRFAGDKLADGVHSMRELFAVDPARAERVLKSYHRHLKQAYPGKGEVEGPKTLESYLKNHPNWDITLQVEKGRIVFGANTQRFDSAMGPIAVFEHMFGAKGHEAAAEKSVNDIVARHAAHGAKAVLTELNDPRIMSKDQLAEDATRPFARCDHIEFMKQLGFQAIDAPYGQPSFGMPGEEVTHLVAGLRVIDPSILQDGKLSKDAHAQIIGGFFATFDNLLGKDVNLDPTYAAIRRFVPESGTALVALDAERSFLKEGAGRDWASA